MLYFFGQLDDNNCKLRNNWRKKVKYKAYKQQSGTWFVNTYKQAGQQYGKVFATEQEAREFALMESHSYYQDQMDKAWKELEGLCGCGMSGEIKPIGYDEAFDRSDMMC